MPIKRCSFGVITAKPPSDIPLLCLNRSRGVAMVQIWPSPLVISLYGFKPIKRCSNGSDMTKPPGDFSGSLAPIKRCSYSSNTTKPPSDIVALHRSRGVAMVRIRPKPPSDQWYDKPIRYDTHVWTAHHGSRSSSATFNFLQEINSSWTGILNRILRASKLCGR